MVASFGWAGTILFVDLSDGSITRVPTTDYQPEEFIGGLGLNTKIFWELGCPEVDAFSPDNPIIISGNNNNKMHMIGHDNKFIPIQYWDNDSVNPTNVPVQFGKVLFRLIHR